MIRLNGDSHHRPRNWAGLSQETPEEGAVEGEDDPLSLDVSILNTFYTLIWIDFILNSQYILYTNLNRFYPQFLIHSIH